MRFYSIAFWGLHNLLMLQNGLSSVPTALHFGPPKREDVGRPPCACTFVFYW